MLDGTEETGPRAEPEIESRPFDEVLLGPPHQGTHLWVVDGSTPSMIFEGEPLPKLPNLIMQCDPCEGERHFAGRWFWIDTLSFQKSNQDLLREAVTNYVAHYVCRNCGSSTVRMYLRSCRIGNTDTIAGTRKIRKVGQDPSYRLRVPKRVQRLVTGDDWGLYQKARISESLGLGIAAFSYYRRVVEDIWRKLLDKLVEVAQRTNEPDLVKSISAARNNWQFRNAVNEIAPAVPARLMIGGHNPLTLLHNAFSDGVHNLSDQECLERAQDGRRVLEEFIGLVAEVLSDQSELLQAVNRLSASRTVRERSAVGPSTGNSPGENRGS